MFGASHGWHCPIVEYVVPVQATQVGGSSDDGPWPAPHGRQVVFASFTTLGSSHTVHSTPNDEYVAPSHATQAVRSTFGASPAEQAEQERVCFPLLLGGSPFPGVDLF